MALINLRLSPVVMAAETLSDRSLHNQVQAFILRATYEGRLQPGGRLNETLIAAQLGISRTPVREALTVLESSGLVTRRPRKGFYLATLSRADATHCYAMRKLLEGYAARQVAGKLTPDQIDTLQSIVDSMSQVAGHRSWPELAAQNIAFHEAVVGFAGNPALLRMWRSVGPVLWVFDSLRGHAPDPPAPEAFKQRHSLLLTALQGPDAAAAAAAFVRHIEMVEQDLMHRLIEVQHARVEGGEG